jgi:hypothetical protein
MQRNLSCSDRNIAIGRKYFIYVTFAALIFDFQYKLMACMAWFKVENAGKFKRPGNHIKRHKI